MGVQAAGRAAVEELKERVRFVASTAAKAAHRPSCFLTEWIDPPFCRGHWGPELVKMAGGFDPLGRKGEASTRICWEEVIRAQPEITVLACCGYTVELTMEDYPTFQAYPDCGNIPAVQHGRVYAANGSAHFSRPGHRIVDSLEIPAEMLHPELFGGCFPDRGVVCLPGKTA